MNKTKPIGVRFDPDKLNFIKEREKLKSYQQVVDFLLNTYWWQHKMPVATHKEAPPLHLKEEIVPVDQADESPAKQSFITTRLTSAALQTITRKYVEEKLEVTSPEAHRAWLNKLQSDSRLTDGQRDQIIKTIQ